MDSLRSLRKRASLGCIGLAPALLLILAGGLAAAQSGGEPAAPPELARQLRGLEQEIAQSKNTVPPLPPAWRVQTPDGVSSISTEPLRRYLASSNRESAAVWLDQAVRQLDGWQSPAGAAATRSKLDRILAQKEFARSGPPGPLELLRRRIAAWIDGILAALESLISSHPETSRVLFWILVLGAAAMLILWLVRLGQREGSFLALRGAALTTPLRDSEEWIAWAHAAAGRGDLRQAIHCAYWAGVVQLQQAGVLAAGRISTPREYLRVTAKSRSASGSGQVEHLAALTNSLERFWYADRAAGPDDFRDSLRHLEGLGCKVG